MTTKEEKIKEFLSTVNRPMSSTDRSTLYRLRHSDEQSYKDAKNFNNNLNRKGKDSEKYKQINKKNQQDYRDRQKLKNKASTTIQNAIRNKLARKKLESKRVVNDILGGMIDKAVSIGEKNKNMTSLIEKVKNLKTKFLSKEEEKKIKADRIREYKKLKQREYRSKEYKEKNKK